MYLVRQCAVNTFAIEKVALSAAGGISGHFNH